MKLYLVRHGNTFGPGDKVVRAGSTTDYPLVEKGKEQANAFGNFLRNLGIVPDAIYTSSLQRTSEFAQITAKQTGYNAAKILTDDRLMELDYGSWSGLTDEEIRAQFGNKELEDWNKSSVWPQSGVFGASEQQVSNECSSFLQDLSNKHSRHGQIVAVSSNGRLRYFLKSIAGEFEKRTNKTTFKVNTGSFCVFHYQENGWVLDSWNEAVKM